MLPYSWGAGHRSARLGYSHGSPIRPGSRLPERSTPTRRTAPALRYDAGQVSRTAKSRLITIGLLAAVAVVVAARQTDWRQWFAPPAEPTPQDAVYQMFAAAQKGDVASYRKYLTATAETDFSRALREAGEARFGQELARANILVKGLALSDLEPQGQFQVRLRAEYVYADRNEVQWLVLEKQPGGWKVAAIENAERVKTATPYATPVQ